MREILELTVCTTLFSVATCAAPAHAEESEGAAVPRAPLEDQPPLLPLSPVSTRRLVAAVSSGYETSANAGEGTMALLLGLGEHVHILGSMEWSIRTNALRPTLGIGVSTGRDRGGFVGRLAYRSEGFSEPEGEVEVTCVGQLRFGRGSLLEASAVYGQDLDGAERDVEQGFSASVPHSFFARVGIAERARFSLPSISRAGDAWDARIGAFGAVRIGSASLVVFGGPSVGGEGASASLGVAMSATVLQAF